MRMVTTISSASKIVFRLSYELVAAGDQARQHEQDQQDGDQGADGQGDAHLRDHPG